MVTHNDVSLPPSATRRGFRNCFRYFCYCFFFYIFTVFVLLGIFTLVLNLLGKTPLDGDIPSIEIHRITVSNFNLSNPITAHWKINMTMQNNCSSFEFSKSTISIFHETKEEALWMMSLKKFDMRPKNSTFHFALDFWGSSADVDNTTLRSIGENITNNLGAVKFNVQFKADKPRTTKLKHSIEKLWFESKINMLIIGCDVLLRFGPVDKTHADMSKADSQECVLVTYDLF
ncbi:hypothetical protein POM88_009335 [Heracleum sosnowskyi]|uniref:Late embryogenesis abundant protein LEA-2 subgroup domain-containing protein n=1 Tax=Heracleum sosnowskyi TaxID=360622 RepID=A0AAD8J864_9APIA|nr:hypothetical protein POM88_009335 [Heracleum sosnowskyi]